MKCTFCASRFTVWNLSSTKFLNISSSQNYQSQPQQASYTQKPIQIYIIKLKQTNNFIFIIKIGGQLQNIWSLIQLKVFIFTQLTLYLLSVFPSSLLLFFMFVFLLMLVRYLYTILLTSPLNVLYDFESLFGCLCFFLPLSLPGQQRSVCSCLVIKCRGVLLQ